MSVPCTPCFAAACCVAAIALSPPAAAFGKYDALDGDECRAQVNANFDAIAREMRAKGNDRGIAAMDRRGREPALEECAQMDRQVRQRRMRQAYDRLAVAIETLRAGGRIEDDEKGWLREEHHAIRAFPDSPYRRTCLQRFREFERYLEQPPPTSADCGRIRAALESARRDHDVAVAALARRDEAWRAHDERNRAAIAEMRLQQSLAERARCR